jgi:uncharacterized protein
LCLQVTAQKSLPKPNPASLVVDRANVIADYDEQQLKQKLIALDDSSSNQICVVTIPTLNGEVIEEVANKTYRDWGIGNKKTNNGILILVAINDRKIRIEVGYGLEGAIPDVTANDIIENDIKPAFKQGNYFGGINTAVDHLAKAAVGEYKVKREKVNSNGKSGGIFQFIFIMAIIIAIIAIIKGGGGGNGGYNRRGLSGADFILPLLFNSGGGGGFGGGGFGGGGDSGGGFGGFGGGSSGGGGASGSW